MESSALMISITASGWIAPAAKHCQLFGSRGMLFVSWLWGRVWVVPWSTVAAFSVLLPQALGDRLTQREASGGQRRQSCAAGSASLAVCVVGQQNLGGAWGQWDMGSHVSWGRPGHQSGFRGFRLVIDGTPIGIQA